MPITLEFEHARKLGIARFSGSVDTEDFNLYMQAWSRPDVLDYDELAIGTADLHISRATLLEHARAVLAVDPFFDRRVRTAIVEISGEGLGDFWNTAYSMLTAAGRQVRLFESEVSARAWLAEPMESRQQAGFVNNG